MQRFFLTFLILLLPVLAISIYIYYEEFKNEKTVLEVQAVESLNGQNEQITSEFTYVVSDLLFLAEQHELQIFLENGTTQRQQVLAQGYKLFAVRKKLYDQIRFLDNRGMELARANFNSGNPTVVPVTKLQDKSQRYYFQDALALNQGEIFISPFDLNVENGQIEHPLNPTIRFATPVFDRAGQKRGIMLLNYLGDKLLQKLAKIDITPSNNIMLLNAAGFWLKGINPEDEWGFMYTYGSKQTFGNRFPFEWQQLNTTQSGQFYSDNGLFTFLTIYPFVSESKLKNSPFPINAKQDYYWKIISYVPTSVLQVKSILIIKTLAMPFLALILLIAIIAMLLSKFSIKHAIAEQALRESEERFKTIVANIPVPLAITRLEDSALLYVNEYFGKSFNISHHLLIGCYKCHNLFSEQNDWQLLLTRFKNDGYVHNFETQAKKISGELFWVNISLQPMVFNGEPAMIGILHDITERKQASEKIQQQNNFLQNVIDSLDYSFYVINADTYQIELANSTTQQIGNWTETTCYQLTHCRDKPCVPPEHICPLKEVKKTKKPTVVEHIHYDKDGKPGNFEVHSFPITSETGEVTQVIEYSINITKRKQAENYLRESENRYRQMFEKHSSIHLLIDPISTELVDANPAAAEFYGYPLPKLKQMNVADINILALEDILTKLSEAKNGKQRSFIMPHRLANGEIRQVNVHYGPLEIKGRLLLYAVVHDVTEEMFSKEQLHKQNEKLQAQNQQLNTFAKQLEEVQRERLYQLNKAYERFVPCEFLSLLDKQSIVDVQLGDQVEKEITVLFADIRNFTSISEEMSPQDNFDFINAYLSRMEPTIGKYYGFVDKYIGDAIMALFPTCADHAAQAAIEMLKRLAQYNLTRGRPGRPVLNIGVGLNTGLLMLGTVGGQNRMEGTVISDSVNLASRIESMTKIYGVKLLISEETYSNLRDASKYAIRIIDRVKVKGKTEPVTIYEIFDGDPQHIIDLKMQTRHTFEQGLTYYRQKQFLDAKQYFKQILRIHADDKAVQIYHNRCMHFHKNGVPDNWDGIEALDAK